MKEKNTYTYDNLNPAHNFVLLLQHVYIADLDTSKTFTSSNELSHIFIFLLFSIFLSLKKEKVYIFVEEIVTRLNLLSSKKEINCTS